jgi:phospholipid-binding lipoprotein MlaA
MKPVSFFLKTTKFAGLVALSVLTTDLRADAPAVHDEPDEYAVARVSDPFESVNRALFKFNDGFYKYAFRPVAHGYERITPRPVRQGINNFFDNLKFPVRFVSCLFQGKVRRAGLETQKFLLNSTAGVAGFFRVSDSVPRLVDVPPEDVGLTFGAWRIGTGPYLVLPFFGPSSLRDAVGLAGNAVLNPVWSPASRKIEWYDSTWRFGIRTLNLIELAPEQMRAYDGFRKLAVDPYVSVRNGYLQYRAALAKK